MSWPLASFALLALALAGGAAWYERTRPSARTVALVATLGALAALGRIAFAPLPNVKPTTDIVLVTGAALGGAPAFVVGAVSALASNLFFGQGYWTPWQMLAWGLVGLGGAALGRLTRRNPGRLALAVAGAVAGLGFGAIMNFSTWVSFSDHSLDAYLAMAGSALAFDIAHAVGNVLFALAFGPALLRAIRRFRQRFEVTWRPSPTAAAPAVLVGLAVAAALAVVAPPAEAATSVDYLRRAQNADGGWGAAPAQGSAQLYTGWAALGLAAAGRNPLDVRRGDRSALSYIRKGAAGVTDAGELERTILVLSAAGVSSQDVGGRDLIAALLRFRRGDGSINGQVVYSSFGVLALRGAGRGTGDRTVRGATAWIVRQQNGDGGFNVFRRGGSSGIDETGAATQALAAGGRRGAPAVDRAVGFLRRQQNPDGGFPAVQGAASNAQSTAYAAQALVAAGADPDRGPKGGGRGALGYLRSLTASNGAVRYSRTSTQTPVWVTAQALLALSRAPFPLPRARAARGAGAGAAAVGRDGLVTLDEAVGGGKGAEPARRRKARARKRASRAEPAVLEASDWEGRAQRAGFGAGVLFAVIAG